MLNNDSNKQHCLGPHNISLGTHTHGDVYSLAAVDDDVLRPAATLQHAHLGVVAAATEEAGGLNAKVSDALLVVVHEAEAVLLQDALVLLFDFLPGEKNNNNNNVWLSVEEGDSQGDYTVRRSIIQQFIGEV